MFPDNAGLCLALDIVRIAVILPECFLTTLSDMSACALLLIYLELR
jgi:hypothetical protein